MKFSSDIAYRQWWSSSQTSARLFDLMKPDRSVERLLGLNVPPSLVQVIQGFFNSWQQRVKFNNKTSTYQACHLGVLQGTTLVPILWNVFIHDRTPALPPKKYANDTTIYSTVEKTEVLVSNSTIGIIMLLLCLWTRRLTKPQSASKITLYKL